uniref:Protein kinase domain-containing protein n=1 Tax=Oryza punctata TaxID=4537 RepID=A0A0E0LH08_ORYPU
MREAGGPTFVYAYLDVILPVRPEPRRRRPNAARHCRWLRESLRYYLHEHKITVHYDINPGNVLLDGGLTPKVVDFGLARLVSRSDAHVSVPRLRRASRRSACDVCSLGMLLFEIVRRRRNLDDGAQGSQQQWFPMLAWNNHEAGHLAEAI